MKKTLLLGLVLMAGIACKEKAEKKSEEKTTHTLFVGTYTNGDSEGIYKYTLDATTGVLGTQELAAKLKSPSYLTISEDKNNLYAIQETGDFDSLGGGVTAFRLNEGVLEVQNSKGTHGNGPCHVSLSGDGYLAAANYGGGNVALYQLNGDGSLAGEAQVIDHKILDTTKTSRAHMAKFTKDGLFVADLGLDGIKRYKREGDQYVVGDQTSIDLAAGAGPRHFTFGKNGNILYVISELNSTVSVFEKDSQGAYQEIQTESTLAEGYAEKSYCADIHLSPDGKFLYGSNRGENTIVIFAVDQESGKLTLVGRESVRGDWPRNFSLDPTGEFLLVANQRSNNIIVFKRDAEKGTLQFLSETNLGSPVCIAFLN